MRRRTILSIFIYFIIIMMLDNLVYWIEHSNNSDRYVRITEGFEFRFGDSPFSSTGRPLWIYDDNSPKWKLKTADKIPIQDNNGQKYVWLKVTLPKGDWKDPILYIYRSLDIFQMYANNKLIYSFGDWKAPSKLEGYPSHFISIPKELLGKTVYFRIYSDYTPIGLSNLILLGNTKDIILDLIRGDLDKYIVSILFSFLSVISLILYWKNRNEKGFLYFAFFSMNSSVVVITQQVKSKFLWNLPLVDYYLNIIAIFIIIFPFLLFVEHIYIGPNRTVIERLKQISLFFFVFVMIITLINPKYLIIYKLYELDALIILISLIAVLSILLISLRKKPSREQRIIVIGISLFTLVCIKDSILEIILTFTYIPQNLHNYLNNVLNLSIHWALSCLIVSFGIILFNRFNKVYQNNKVYAKKLKVQNKELIQMDKLKDEFLAKTSHELRTPLNGMIGLTESLIDGACGEVNIEMRKNLSMIFMSGKRLTNLINDILDITKLKYDEINLQLKPVGMREMTDLVMELIVSLYKKKSIRLINSIYEHVPLVYADENRVQQIMYNLLGNAVKYTENGIIEISAKVTDDFLEISVSDTGIGISEEKSRIIFESFHQAEETISRQYGGTGLGLSITKSLVELHGGKLTVTSKEGVGSTFTFSLPLFRENVSNENAFDFELKLEYPIYIQDLSQTLDIETNKMNGINLLEPNMDSFYILVVDDEMINIQVLFNYLSLENYKIMYASSGMEALDILDKGFEPDLIILDVMMPKMSGFDVIKEIRKTYTMSELPIILLTAKNLEQDLVMGFEMGANDYLVKPFLKRELLSRVKMHIKLTQTNKLLEITIKERTAMIKNLLNHADQGFLSFEQDLKVQEEFSAECVRIFDTIISNYNVPEMLFPEDFEKQELAKTLLSQILISDQSFEQLEPYKDLLPSITKINSQVYNIDYKFFVNNGNRTCMVVLTNITEQQELLRQLEQERNILNMIVQVSINPNVFFECIRQINYVNVKLKRFINLGYFSELPLLEIYKKIHSLKGNFAQLYMLNTVTNLQEFEKKLYDIKINYKMIKNTQKLIESLNCIHFSKCAEEDIRIIKSILGERFFQTENHFLIDQWQLRAIEEKIQERIVPEHSKWLLKDIKELQYQYLRDIVQFNSGYLVQMADNMGKKVHPIRIDGGEVMVDRGVYLPLCEKLIHIFRNNIEHGIEFPDERIKDHKDIYGTIQCIIKENIDDSFLSITICDDGRGIDPEKIRISALQKGIISKRKLRKLTDDEVLKLIFCEGFSTMERLNEWSGNGMGLSAVRDAVITLGGKIKIQTEKGKGTEFRIEIPFNKTNAAYNLSKIPSQV